MSRRRRALLAVAIALAVLLPTGCAAVAWIRVAADDDTPSVSRGSPARGVLYHGHALPPWGPGYRTASMVIAALGRQYLHGDARDTLRAAFAARAAADPGRVHVVGETAVRKGGRFNGHRTHQNGLSVDLFMPLRDAKGEKTTLPTWPWNAFGYWWEFDAQGQSKGLQIDFEELATTIQTISDEAEKRNLEIERVIITPEYVPLVLGTESGKRLGPLATRFTRKPVWVRHDEHVHIDFRVMPRGRRIPHLSPELDDTGR